MNYKYLACIHLHFLHTNYIYIYSLHRNPSREIPTFVPSSDPLQTGPGRLRWRDGLLRQQRVDPQEGSAINQPWFHGHQDACEKTCSFCQLGRKRQKFEPFSSFLLKGYSSILRMFTSTYTFSQLFVALGFDVWAKTLSGRSFTIVDNSPLELPTGPRFASVSYMQMQSCHQPI